MKLRKYLKVVLIVSILSVGMLLKPQICSAEDKDTQGITTLEADKEYLYDLDGNGEKEKVKFQYKLDEKTYSTEFRLYINDKLCIKKKSESSFAYVLQIFDLDKNDKAMDLFYSARMDSDGVNDATFARYDGTSIVENNSYQFKKDYKKFNTFRYSLANINGDSKFNIILDTPVFSETTGCYCCYIPYQIKDNVISKVTTNTFELTKYSKSYKHKVQKSFCVYKEIASKSIAFKVKKGDTITFDQIYISKSGKFYVRAINKNGLKGWIKAKQKGLFKEYPAWG